MASSIGARVLTVGLVAAMMAVVGSSAHAAPSGDDPSTSTTYSAGRYVVMLREPAAASSRTTRSDAGRFDARSTKVAAYSSHLRRVQSDVAGEYGARPVDSFTVAANGFVADLSAAQALDLATDRRVLLVEKSRTLHLDTWRSPEFLGLSGTSGTWKQHGSRASAGSGVVVGVLDSGIWPESKSFAGKPLTKKPKTTWDISRHGQATRMEKVDGSLFTGRCVVAERWTRADCNTKLIGARFYPDSFLESVPRSELADTEQISARDGDGHGSHTASTAAGNVVDDVTTERRDFGTVSGMAPGARVAVYKVCWEAADEDLSGCNNLDSVAAIEQAVIDGVDVINFSVGGGASPTLDAIELAFEGAAEAGIFVATSAGNSGPDPSTLDHPAPWVTTVAASTHVRFENTVLLGNGVKLLGASIATRPVPKTRVIDSAKAAAPGSEPGDADLCGPKSLDAGKVKGKIVVCLRGVYDRVAKSAEVKRAGGVAMILVNPSPNSLDADFHAVPTIHLPDTDGPKLFKYLAKASRPVASFLVGNQTRHVTPLPVVAGFSSRGPVLVANGDLLKPDITAPGVSVLAAVAPPANQGRKYDLYSGTSMASPHIAGLAAFLVGERPAWTPMQVKSAMMTTAVPTLDDKGKRSRDALAQGAGQVTPRSFFDPGLFVTSDATQWRGFITAQGIATGVPALAAKKVNLPSMADGAVTAKTTFRRTFRATRVGTWKISASVPGFRVTTTPKRVRADRQGDLIGVKFTFRRTDAKLGRYTQGAVTLDGPTTVRLPVALQPVSVDAPLSVTGTAPTGTVTVPLTAGFTGDLSVAAHGLAKSTTVAGSVAAAADAFHCVTVTPGTTLARFRADSTDDTADIDLVVLASKSCNPDDAVGVAGQSGTASGDEQVTLRDPDPGTYIAVVNGFSAGTAGSPIGYAFDFWDVDPSAVAGGLQVSPNPVPVRAGKQTSVSLSWSGLAPASKYLGFLSYQRSGDITVVEVTTP
ncbi:S8 family serine peptidase [Nocardioides sp. MAH-18]|uniref:S8 family serine peptidase n=1 Tax=Nocardioides agri TaxID=2682843 RepID=A0A6L6XQX6_9ACTN|nr:S8 family peptidase [Nocardioides sp. CGMCC 1.13656]MBA2954917.1 S8 family serine peptidase [Nocardioides sp. CGMCC 1.13656]MVQ49771.1 S8 family serine peptidase [Nocardioides sp. MAH-18]